LIALLVVCVAAFVILDYNLRPVIIAMAEAKVRAIAVKAINDAVLDIMDKELKYTDLINIIQDKDGGIAMVQANTIRMNELAAQTALMAQENIAQIEEQGIAIPIGSALGGQLLAGRGPRVHIKIIPVGSVITEFVTEFQKAGINQTRQKIYLKARTSIRIVIPTGSSKIEIESQIPISESIIVGSVPQSYVDVTDSELPNILPGLGENVQDSG
jgi:sporulation protein YunB